MTMQNEDRTDARLRDELAAMRERHDGDIDHKRTEMRVYVRLRAFEIVKPWLITDRDVSDEARITAALDVAERVAQWALTEGASEGADDGIGGKW